MTDDDGRVTPLWLSHHWPEDYDRCTTVAGRHVCRRCLVLYPIAFVVLAASVLGARLSPTLALAAYALLSLPALVDFVVEHLGLAQESPHRLVVVTVPLGVGMGLGFASYVHAPGDPWFWLITIGYAIIAGAAWATGRRWR